MLLYMILRNTNRICSESHNVLPIVIVTIIGDLE